MIRMNDKNREDDRIIVLTAFFTRSGFGIR